jgi:hypothetical protein
VSGRRLELQNRFYNRMRSRGAYRAAERPSVAGARFDSLSGHNYALMIATLREGKIEPGEINLDPHQAPRVAGLGAEGVNAP